MLSLIAAGVPRSRYLPFKTESLEHHPDMRRKRKEDFYRRETVLEYSGTIWKMFSMPKWWIFIVCLTGKRREKKMEATL